MSSTHCHVTKWSWSYTGGHAFASNLNPNFCYKSRCLGDVMFADDVIAVCG